MSEHQDQQVQLTGKRLLRGLFVLYRKSAQYQSGHPVLAKAAQELIEAVRDFRRWQEDAALVLRNNHLFLGEQRIKPDAGGFESFYGIMRFMRALGVGTIQFSESASPADVCACIQVLREAEQFPGPNPFESLCERLRRKGVETIEFLPMESGDYEGVAEVDDAKARAKTIYVKSLGALSDVMSEMKAGRSLKVRRLKRVVQTMVDTLLTAEPFLLGLTTIHSHDEYTYNHSVNVGILSMALGQRVGLSRPTLVDLGIAALFHDIGKASIPIEILNKPEPLSPEEWALMRCHPAFGVKELLRLRGVDLLTARTLCGVFEHHQGLDGSGYPTVAARRESSLFGRIIAIADCYDALTSARVYRRVAEPPEKVLQYLMAHAGSTFDPILLKLFVNIVGVYPIGTLCRLDTGELAVVLRNHPDGAHWDHPVVKVVADAEGKRQDGPSHDLSDPQLARRITATLDARALGIEVAHCFV